MDEMKLFIQKQIKSSNHSNKRISIDLNSENNNYETWLKTIKSSIAACKYREAIKKIELKKNKFCNLNNCWKYQILEIKCILKVIKKKLSKHSQEIINENQKQNHSIKFWFNEVFYILEILTIKIRPDINNNINIDEEKNLNIIEYIVQAHLNTLYILCLYSKLINEIPQLCSYFAMTDRLFSYINFTRNPKTLNLFQRILLLRVNLNIENLDFCNSLKYQKISMDTCFREFFLLVDFDDGLNSNNISLIDKNKNFLIYKNIINMVLCFYLRGICFELLGNINLSIESYKQSRWLCDKFLYKIQPEFTFFMKKIEKRSFIYYKIFHDIKKELKKVKDEFEIIKENELINLQFKEHEEFLTKIANGQSINNFGNLENILEKIGHLQLKDIEIEKYNLGKSKKSKFILSTISIINNLLSDDFTDVLQNMKKIEINKMDKTTKKSIYKKIEYLKNNNRSKSCVELKSPNKRIISPFKLKSPNFTRKGILYLKSDSKNIHNKINNFNINNNSNNKNKTISHKIQNKRNHFIVNYNLSKSHLEKKKYLENLSRKEIDFHKKNLYAKRFEIDPDVEIFNRKKVNIEAEKSFNYKLLLAKFQINKKTNLKDMIKSNLFNTRHFMGSNSRKKIYYQPLTPSLKQVRKSKRLSLTSQSFISNSEIKLKTIKVDKDSINSGNINIIKQLNKETYNINKTKEEKNKLYKSCSANSIFKK